jgi:hypothetical protein
MLHFYDSRRFGEGLRRVAQSFTVLEHYWRDLFGVGGAVTNREQDGG